MRRPTCPQTPTGASPKAYRVRDPAHMPLRTDIDLQRQDDLLLSQHHCVTLKQLAEVGLASSTIAYRPDGWYEAGVALEVNSRKYHLDPESWEATQERWSRMARLDITVIPVTPQRRRRDSPGLMSDIRAALDSARLRPPPRVTFKRRSQAA